MNKRKNLTFRVALGGVTAAVSLILMLVAGMTTSFIYAIPMIAGAFLMMLVVEFGYGFAFVEYIAVALLSLLLLGDKEAAVLYAVFFGYYPIIKAVFEKHLKKMLCRIVKFLAFNLAMLVYYFVMTKLFMLSFDDIASFGKFALPLLLAAGNVLFVMYDVLLTRLVSIYIFKWRKSVRRVFK